MEALILLTAAALATTRIPHPLPAAGDAAERAASARTPIALWREARGLDRVDGELWAAGATYKARFDRGGLMVVPPLGPDAPRSLPLWLAFDSAEIGGRRLLTSDGSAEPERGELDVRYRHGAALTERYEVRSEGLEQSFAFHELPAERAELVVRLRIATELVPRADGEGLFFEGAPGRGLRVGGLTAIDAAGRRTAGVVRLAGDALELVAPAEFVAQAELPLVLDPIIGGPIDVYLGAGEVGDPDLAYDHFWSYGLTLVAFERFWAADEIDIYAQRIDAGTGSLVGSLEILEAAVSTRAMNPSVASSSALGGAPAFLVAWQEGNSAAGPFNVVGKCMSFLPPVLSEFAWLTSKLVIANDAASETDPDTSAFVATSSSCDKVGFLVAYARSGIRARPFDIEEACTTGGVHPLTFGPEVTVSSNPTDAFPSTQVVGSEVLLAWERWFATPAPGDHDLYCAVVRNLVPGAFSPAVVTPPQPVATTVGPDEVHADAGRISAGTACVAFERAPSSTSSDDDVYLTELAVAPTPLGTIVTTGPTFPIAVGAGDDDAPATSTSGDEVWVGWIDHGSLGLGTVRALGPFIQGLSGQPIALQPCEPEFEVAGSAIGAGFQELEIVSTLIGGVAAFESIGLGVYAQALKSVSTLDDVSQAGSSFCRPAAYATRTCRCGIGLNFMHALEGAEPNRPAFLIMSGDYFGVWVCNPGECSLVPDPFTGFVIAAGNTSAFGTALVPMPIAKDPALVGVVFYDQWAVAQTLPDCPALGVSLSSALRFEVQAP